ncbi:hypothetical protein AAF463_24030 (plasmid) [Pantoea sp. BJ2]|uniref:Uncharacterized protein n=1 Tax=Pantoea sp. BJ2 TaxID=3141322 RepID=A0AAU7U3F2_9GAMM
MPDKTFTLISEIIGIPFISDIFRSAALLRLITDFRQSRFGFRRPQVEYLNPEVIFMDFRAINSRAEVSYPNYGNLDAQRSALLSRTKDKVLKTMP